ncbi:MAG: hypothetical protein HWN67_09575 [Candidatus Helarchaeota archaeon]|nr:hypothetical protein [Candidatus Helarchaeota archaeon]
MGVNFIEKAEKITGIVKEEFLSGLTLYILLDNEGNSCGIIDLPPELQKDGISISVDKEKLKIEKETGLTFASLLLLYMKEIEIDEFISTIKNSSPNNSINAFYQLLYQFSQIYIKYQNTLFKNTDLFLLVSKIIVKFLWEIESAKFRQNNPIKSEDLKLFNTISPKFEDPLDTVMCFLYLAFVFNIFTKIPNFYEHIQELYEKKEYYWLLAARYSKYIDNPDFFYGHGIDRSEKGYPHVYYFKYKKHQVSFHSKWEWNFPNFPEVGENFWDGINHSSFPWDLNRCDFFNDDII